MRGREKEGFCQNTGDERGSRPIRNREGLFRFVDYQRDFLDGGDSGGGGDDGGGGGGGGVGDGSSLARSAHSRTPSPLDDGRRRRRRHHCPREIGNRLLA